MTMVEFESGLIGGFPGRISITLPPSGNPHCLLSETGSWLVEPRKRLEMRISMFTLGFHLSKKRVFSRWGFLVGSFRQSSNFGDQKS
jgi:hypothetical protein